MKVTLNDAAQIAMRTLGDEDRRKIHAWIDHLANWEQDAFVRSRALQLTLPHAENIYVLRTSTDLRLFFVLGEEHIEVIDIARRDSLETVRQAS